MRILLVSRAFPPALNVEGMMTARLAGALAERGLDMVVLTARGREATAIQQVPEGHRNCTVLHIPAFAGPISRRVLVDSGLALRSLVPPQFARFVALGQKLFDQVLKTGTPDFIYARGVPAASYYLAVKLARRSRIPLVVNFSDPWPGNHFPPPYPKPGLLQLLPDLMCARQLAASACLITCPSQRLVDYLRGRNRRLRDKRWLVLPHIAPRSVPRPVQPNGRGRRMRIVHVGTIYGGRDPRPFLLALKRFLSQRPGAAEAVFAGVHGDLARVVQDMGLSQSVSFLDPVPPSDALQICAQADLLLLIEASTASGIFLPGKFVDYCATDRPILALSPVPGEVADYLAMSDDAVAHPNDPEAIAAALAEFHNRWLNGRMAPAKREQLRSRFSPAAVSEKLIAELLALRQPVHTAAAGV